MRRFIDVVSAALLLVLLAPVLIMVAIAVAIDSPGNPFYRAHRIGRHGRAFRMWKFRTMVPGAAAMGSVTGRNDSRITRLGRLLRKTKVDELPQFINVVLGDMTLVGPRPETPDMVARYTPFQRAVLAVKPGVTGKVQLEAGDESESIPEGAAPEDYYVSYLMDRKIRLDLRYLESRTALTDLRIVLETVFFILRAVAGAVVLPGRFVPRVSERR